jgi:hypothetical protein
MMEILNSYLLQRKIINIPGMGSIYILDRAAITDFVNKQLFPSSYSFRFDKYQDVPEPGFYQYLSEKEGISENEAMDWYNDFASSLRSKIKNDGFFHWQGVGTIKKDDEGDIVIEDQVKLLPFLSPVPAKRVIRKDAKHAILVGDNEKTNVQMSELLHEPEGQIIAQEKSYWWIYAIVLAALAAGLIFYHFYEHGFRWGSTANQQKIMLESR